MKDNSEMRGHDTHDNVVSLDWKRQERAERDASATASKEAASEVEYSIKRIQESIERIRGIILELRAESQMTTEPKVTAGPKAAELKMRLMDLSDTPHNRRD